MRLRSQGVRSLTAGTIVALFLALSFNAHACLVPLFSASGAAMANGCSSPDEQPVRQFCETYKTLAVQSSDELTPGIDSQIICTASGDVSAPDLGTAVSGGWWSEHPAAGPPPDLLLKTVVLRI